ncbi:hypothetical protein F4775DRAFT_604505 [Biscogniauxia sp. FL1348]|nr:hypothetical protein F4775DRAFT_604505 [Biscogniauxia sp. FL1348]
MSGFQGPAAAGVFASLSVSSVASNEEESTFVKDTRTFIKENTKIPKEGGYDWLPFFSALREEALDKFHADPDSESESEDVNGDVRPRRPGQDRFRVAYDPDKVPSKLPGSGSFDYVWYVPEWTHPDFDPTTVRTYTGKQIYVASGENTIGLWPALRKEDQIKNPTSYARRFGIHPDELNGRSRASPSLSRTRNPFDDLANQINMLSDVQKNQAIQASQQLWQSKGINPESHLIDPSAIEPILQNMGALSNEELGNQLVKALQEKKVSVEEFVDQINQGGPLVSQAHKTFIDTILRDQDYQRLLFNRFTTDELIQNNIYDQSDNYICDLRGPLHPVIDRNHWESSSWKGALAWAPRYLYNLNGIRQEWDVTTNDSLWLVLQPALQLVTRILDSKHPNIEALLNMETRQWIDQDQDPRIPPRGTRFLTKYVLEKDIDPEKMPSGIAELRTHGFDWKKHTWDVLHKSLRFDIGAGYIIPGHDDKFERTEGVNETTEFTYGSTTENVGGMEGVITITISAELLWPLLVDEYSQSEKMTCSFIVASTILHELSHAITMTHQAMMRLPAIIPYPLDRDVVLLLKALETELFDTDWCLGEHCFAANGTAEVGYDTEQGVWGAATDALIENVGYSTSARFLNFLPLMIIGRPWPWSQGASRSLRNSSWPVEEHLMPMPLDWIDRFFTQNFWDVEFRAYGYQSLRQLRPENGDRVMKSTGDRSIFFDTGAAKNHFGREKAKFLSCIPWGLYKGLHPVLAAYLESLVHDVIRVQSFRKRWTDTILSWQSSVVAPLDAALEKLSPLLREAQNINIERHANEKMQQTYWQMYLLSNMGQAHPLNFEVWKAMTEINWEASYRVGGTLMTQFAEVHRFMRIDLDIIERILFDFFNTEVHIRGPLFNTDTSADDTPIGIIYKRLNSFRCAAQNCYHAISAIAQMPPLVEIWQKWGLWKAMFENSINRYDHMLELLEDPNKVTPNENWWKATFKSVPTFHWKSESDRLRVVAFRDYQRLDPRIRKTVDDFSAMLESFKVTAALPDPADVNKLSGVLEKVASNWDDKAKKVINNKPTVFDFKVPKTTPPPGSGNKDVQGSSLQAPSDPSIPLQQPPQNPQGGAATATGMVLQVPGLAVTGLGGDPSRRTMQGIPTSGTSAAANAFTQYAMMNPLQATVASTSANKAGEYPQPFVLQQSATAFGSGLPFAPPLRGQGITPFPHPYADKTTLTADASADLQKQQKEELMDLTTRMFTGPEPYSTKEPWREVNP